jgi:predicted transcriptional regulator
MTKKLDKEHLEALQQLRNLFAENANNLGAISLEQIAINRRLEFLNAEQDKLYSEFEELRNQEQNLLEKMRERYGDGQINLEDGTFTQTSGLAQ